MTNALRPLVDRVAALAADVRGSPHFEWGVVTEVTPLRVRLDGDEAPLLGSPSTVVSRLRIGDRVRVEVQNHRAVVTGRGGGEDWAPPLLWSGVLFMHAAQTITLTQPVSAQRTGILLVWSEYVSGVAQNYGFLTHPVAKALPTLHSGSGHYFPMQNGTQVGRKYLYLRNDRISGHDNNSTAPNNGWVLRYVYGY